MADTKLSDLTETTTYADADELYLNDGAASRRTQLSTFRDGYMGGVGKHTIWYTADSMRPSATAGCGASVALELTAGRHDVVYKPFANTPEQHAQFSISFPKSWDKGTITYQVFWTRIAAPTAGLDDVHWGLQAVSITDDLTLDTAYGSEVEVSLDEAKATNDLWVSDESGAVTIALTPIDNDLCNFQISRVIGSEAGGLDVDACLLGVKIFYTTDAASDA